ncbi:MAG TPA: protease inhibitor I42 family protein [Amycolatopsis sp.]|uniref:protease inhibitor I42 family protein n=1 Tax=Amycolatopsis sp. TaxID=37632 RepID=UPI002B479435|nr:protease inhibitor I42 family protein [Amycolatopsis sp.]HKS44623.1 protease inhibitor I42 family protein [Amycolatopsis sp.]
MSLVRLAQADAGETTELRVGDTVELRLPEARTSGYQWHWQLPEAVQVVVDEYLREDGRSGGAVAQGEQPPGQGGVRRLALDIVGAGRLLIRAELVRPWEREPRRSVTFVLSVTGGVRSNE